MAPYLPEGRSAACAEGRTEHLHDPQPTPPVKPIQVLRNWRQRLDLIRSWKLAPTDVVLEVGSGQNPSPRADILCERYLSDGTERHDALPRVDRPLVVGDLHELPFVDNAVDFVVCTHVLEHVEDPAGAVAELTRVAPRGYLETPSAVWERMHSFPFHRWYVSEEEGVLVFRAKDRPIHDEGAKQWMERLIESQTGLMDYLLQNEARLGTVVGIVWEGAQPVRVEGTPAPETAEGFTGASSPSRADEIEVLQRAMTIGDQPRSMADRVYRTASRRLRRESSQNLDLRGRLRCPICHGQLNWDDAAAGAVLCSGGHRHDAVTVGEQTVPFLLSD